MTEAGPLPELDQDNTFFWTSGADGRLRFLQCGDCQNYVHPPRARCAICRGENLSPQAVSGRGTVLTFTINHQPWFPGMEVPFVVAIVELDEQPGLRLTTNIIECPPEEVYIGQSVRVVFEQKEDVWLPLFEPEEGRS
ncbi:MAG: Zn-ribbon domain-containing OB-fold protein [Myxococcota bacterium]|jgi:uncharacterized OB-fold protein